MSANTNLSEQIKNLPEEPGIYKFINDDEKIIYIGKAKNLKKRVSSYFGKQHGGKTKLLVSKIKSIEFTIVHSESDAFLLENNLIKEHQPKYNINLKDDKTYPFIKITKEPFPRVISIRNKINDGGKYYGPYSSGKTQSALLDFIHTLFPLRTCKLQLTEKNISKKMFRACLEYHLGKCHAPCEGKENEITYLGYIENVKKILSGNINSVKKWLNEEMIKSSEKLNFENAENIKRKIDALDDYQKKTLIVTDSFKDIDVFTIASESNIHSINYLKINNGHIVSTKSSIVESPMEENVEDVLAQIIFKFREEFESSAKELFCNIPITFENLYSKISFSDKGDCGKLIKLSLYNAKTKLSEYLHQKEKNKRKSTGNKILEQAKLDLRLKEIPFHIECFDNSNMQGSFPVASMVCFKNSIPSKKDYRHFNIKTVIGPNDFDSMYEIVHRRYKRLIEENEKLPQLIVIDGGKGQLNKALEALKDLKINGKIAVISIAKRLEEIYFPGDEIPMYLNKNSTTLKLIQKLRNEAHRFAISFHRDKRNKIPDSQISKIKGIGKKTESALLQKFKSINQIKENRMEVEKLIGLHKAEILFNSI